MSCYFVKQSLSDATITLRSERNSPAKLYISQTLVYGFLPVISLAPAILTVFLAYVQVRPKAGGM